MASVLQPLGQNLNVHAVCLQLGFENISENIQGMAQTLLPVNKLHFYLLYRIKVVFCLMGIYNKERLITEKSTDHHQIYWEITQYIWFLIQ